ncbi:hypothetical protein F4806DRAFT_492095 [Annulohypoxylon nitens]|nr:hypothetical protein F4806DRAFT_492095 [Annulohypoxylon nitens]
MAANRQVPGIDFGNTSRNASADQHAVLQNEQPIAYSSSLQISGDVGLCGVGSYGCHVTDNSHPGDGCICGATFSRKDALTRHLKHYSNEVPEYACDHCSERFHRKDKLKLHSKRCPRVNVSNGSHEQRAGLSPLATTSGPSMISNEGAGSSNSVLVPCGVPGCSRAGDNGFYCEEDLTNHRKLMHMPRALSNSIDNASQQEGILRICLRVDPDFRLQDVAAQSPLVNGASLLYQLIDEHQTYWQDNASQLYGQNGTA